LQDPSGGGVFISGGDHTMTVHEPSTQRSHPRMSWLRRVAALLCALGTIGLATQASRADGSDGAPGVALAGTIARLPGCGQTTYAVDPGLGVLIAVYTQGAAVSGCQPGTATQTLAALYSTHTLALLHRATLRAPNQPATFLAPLVDGVRHRLFLVGMEISGGSAPIYRYDIRDLLATTGPVSPGAVFASSLPNKPSAADAANSDQDVSGTAVDASFSIQVLQAVYDAPSDALDVTLFNPDSAGSSNAPLASEDEYLAEVNATTGARRFFLRLGQCVIPQQNSTLDAKDPILHTHGSSPAVAVGCGYHSNLALVDPSGATGAGEVLTTLVPLGSDGLPSGRPFAYLGKTGALGGVADPQTGRIFFAVAPPTSATAGAAAQGPSAVTFDVAHTAYIGAATVNSAAAVVRGFTVGVGGGRLYAVGPGGVFVADATSTPVDPGLIYPAFSCQAVSMVVDSATRRLFVVPDSSCKAFTGRLAVLEDDTEVLQGSDADPDANTHDLDEKPGATQTTFSGRSTGIALRARLVGGITTLENGATLDTYDEFFGPDNPLVPPQGFAIVSRVPNARPLIGRDFSNREVDIARISATDLDNVQANAAAVAGAFDDTSASDLSTATAVQNPPARTGSPSPGATPKPALVPGQQVPFQQAACSAPAKASQTQSYQVLPGTAADAASVTCELSSKVTAAAIAHALGLDAGTGTLVSIASGEVSTSVVKDAKDGVIASVTSTVHGLIVGPVFIDAVSTTTTCSAHGRPGTAHCTFGRSISGVSNAGVALVPASCTESDNGSTGATACQGLIAELNTLTPGKLVFAAPEPDSRRDFLGGSPRGYQAVAQRDLYEHLQDSLLNNDDLLTVPGLDILYVNDTAAAPSRLELQVAGGNAEAHYGINPPFSFGVDDSSGIVPPLLPSTAPGAPLTGIVTPQGTLSGGNPAPPATAPVGGGIPRLISKVWDGLSLLWRSPGTGLLVLLLLGLLGLPLVTAWRRGQLLDELGRAHG
jgi:hypothetical protein